MDSSVDHQASSLRGTTGKRCRRRATAGKFCVVHDPAEIAKREEACAAVPGGVSRHVGTFATDVVFHGMRQSAPTVVHQSQETSCRYV